jgi:hypothetical protein
MAVQVRAAGSSAEAGSLNSPRLYVIDFERERAQVQTIGDRQLAIRRRRYARRLRQAAGAAVWAAGSAGMLVLLVVGVAGLR